MAAVLDAFATKLVGILAGMAKDELEMLLGVPGEITKLDATLGDLSRILADADRRSITDSAVEGWARELKDVMYDADNVLDLCKIMDGGEDPSKSSLGCWSIPLISSCFRNPVAAHEIGKKIQALNQRLLDIEERSSRFGFISQAINNSSSYFPDMVRRPESASYCDVVVGEKIKEDAMKLVDMLVRKDGVRAGSSSSDNSIAVVAITGAAGIGKTTLAKMVFDDEMVHKNFDKRIWLSVGTKVNEIDILQTVVASCGESPAGSRAMLKVASKQALKKEKFLLVLDDAWSDEVWNKVLISTFYGGASGSRVLVTTRNDEVARRMKAHRLHRVDKLSGEDSWSLLKRHAFFDGESESEINRLKDIGMDILETCDGLPLAIKVVGACLGIRRRTRGDWRGVYDNLARLMAASEEISNAIYVGYIQLPSHLKQCLLYCSLFPKDELIKKGVIVRLWIAEGLVEITSSVAVEELGYQYYEELVSRNLLEPDYSSYEISACTMHNVVRSFCQSVSEYDGLLLQEGQGLCITPSASKLRHLSISKTAVEWADLEKHVSLRTLMLFRSTTIESKYLCSNFSCLRVLALKGANLVELPDSISKLKHLRYLGLVNTSISTIPQGIEALKFLQFIELTRNTKLSEISNSILKLQKLRFISFCGTKITSIPRGFRKLEDLVEILGFPTLLDVSTDVWCSLEELGPLSRLRMLDIESLEKASSGSMAARAKLSSKPHLTKLGLAFTSRFAHDGMSEVDISNEEQERAEEVLGNLCPPTCIELLTIDGYFGRRLPQWLRTMTIFESLRRLQLSDYACCELPNGLHQLPFLDYFWVDNAPFIDHIGHDLVLPSLGGDGIGMDKTPASAEIVIVDRRQRHQFSHGDVVAFSKLKTLHLQRMLRWRVWEWGQQARAMPALEELSIDNCKLSHLPCGLAHHAGALKKLDLRNVPHLVCIENFPSLDELMLVENPTLERINNNSSLRHIYIQDCPALKVLEDLPSLQSIEWRSWNLEALPEYLREVKLNKLIVHCCISLLKLISLQDANSDSEWRKIQHVQHVKAHGYISEEEKRYMFYTKEPYSFETNIDETSESKHEDEKVEL